MARFLGIKSLRLRLGDLFLIGRGTIIKCRVRDSNSRRIHTYQKFVYNNQFLVVT